MDKRIFSVFICILAFSVCHAQEITPQVRFQQDSVEIGKPVDLSLWVKYPLNRQLVLPDSTFDYSPFEFYQKSYFPTRADSAFAYDSVVYQLATFEIDSIQRLSLPVFVITKGDSIILKTNLDSVFLQEMITDLPDSIEFRENVAFVPTSYVFNYPYLIIGCGIFVVLVVLIFIFFGKKIRSKIAMYRLKKEYEKFSRQLESGISDIRKNEHNQPLIENILVLWKKYMERLEDRPFTKYTSREIVKAGYGNELKDILKNIDSAIYGNVSDEQMHKNFEMLEDYTSDRYQRKVKEVQNG